MSDAAAEVGAPAASAATYATAPEDALEPALRALVQEAGAVAGAVCLFDPGEGVLRLAAESGLSDAGCRILRAVRPGVSAWEAPLTALLERRSLVAVPGPGTPLPPLAEPAAELAGVACLPLFTDGRPRGTVVLVATRSNAFDDDALDDVAPAVEELETVVDEIHRRVAAITRRPADLGWGFDGITDLALRGIEPLTREVGRVLQSLRYLPGAGTLARVGRVLERMGDGDRLGELEDALHALEVQSTQIETAGRERLADAEARWEARIAEATAALARERDRVHTLERAQERLARDLEEALARERRARQDLTAAIERGVADREETLRQARELAWTAEQRRSAAAAEAESARAALGAAETSMMRLAEEVRQARADVARITAAEQAARTARDHAQTAVEDVRRREEAAAERAHRFEVEVEALRAECRRLESAARDAETAAEARWRSRLGENERAWAADRQRLDALEGEHARALTKLEEVTVREARNREELDAAVARADADREEILQRAHELTQKTEEARAAAVAELQSVREDLADAQAVILHMQESYALTERGAADREETLRYALELKQKSDEARAAAVGEAEAVRSSLANVQGMILDAEEDARRARAETERVTAAAQAAFAARDKSEGLLDEARARENELRTRVTELDQQVRAVREECRRLEEAGRERSAETSASWEARIAETDAAVTRERSRVRELERELDKRGADLAAAQEREQQATQELAALRDRSAYDRDEILGRALELTQAAEEARAAAATEAEAIRTALASAETIVLQAEDEARRARTDVERLEVETQATRAERDQMARALEEARAREADAAARLAEAQAELARVREVPPDGATAARPASPTRAAATPARPATAAATPPHAAAPSGPRVVAVLDEASFWDGVRGGEGLHVLALGPDLPARVAELGPTRMLVNLASPGVLDAMIALRAEGCTARFWGYLGAAGANRMVVLGMVDAASHPLDADGLLGVVSSYATRGTRVLTAGGDANALISLRQALTREGMSVSIAWDAKQAADLLTMVRPEVVIIDLALPPRGGHAIVADLAGLKPLPATILVPRGDTPAAGFGPLLAERVRSEHAMTREQLLDHVLKGRQDPPQPPK